MTGQELRERRQKAGLTQVQLGALLDMPGNTVARYERGEMPIRRVVALALERVMEG